MRYIVEQITFLFFFPFCSIYKPNDQPRAIQPWRDLHILRCSHFLDWLHTSILHWHSPQTPCCLYPQKNHIYHCQYNMWWFDSHPRQGRGDWYVVLAICVLQPTVACHLIDKVIIITFAGQNTISDPILCEKSLHGWNSPELTMILLISSHLDLDINPQFQDAIYPSSLRIHG